MSPPKAVSQAKWRAQVAQLPDMIPKKWIATCRCCLLQYIPNFKISHMGPCPVCFGRKDETDEPTAQLVLGSLEEGA